MQRDTSGDTHLVISGSLRLPLHELELRASRAGGPGGQHVNTSSTRVELWWDVASSPSLNSTQRERLQRELATRLDASGRLRLVAAGSRSQWRNRQEAMERLRQLVADALVVRKTRRKTRPTAASKRARLDAKRRRSTLKRERGSRPDTHE